jgi:hypothetical protein
MIEDSQQASKGAKKFKLSPHLGNLNQVVRALSKTIRVMADGSLDSQVGARICNSLGIMRACLETATLERIEDRLDQLEGFRSYGDTSHNRSHFRTH